MTKRGHPSPALVGVAEQGSTAVLVTVTSAGEALDRRQVELIEPGMPTHPHHHEGSWAVGRYLGTPGARRLALDEAIELVEQVTTVAARRATESLDAIATSISIPIVGIALRVYAELPPTIAERIQDARAQTYADSAMYRQALADAGEARGWAVHWYDRESASQDAARALGLDDLDDVLRAMGRALGPPWQAKHKLAAVGALAMFAHMMQS